jgi:succinyl-diaminopimelate desuccinylase
LTDPLAAAAEDAPSVVALLADLVRRPSRGGIDPYSPVVDVVEQWQRTAGLMPRIIERDGRPVAVVCDVHGARPGPRLVLNACLDTAGLADESAWTHGPFSADIADGWMYGRGTADSKAAVAIFCHLAARLARTPQTFAGAVTVLFDLDEHTGGFLGIRTYLDTVDDITAVMIGYPGEDKIVIGGRGFLRARATLFGYAGHSGSSRHPGVNAVLKAVRLVQALTLPIPATSTRTSTCPRSSPSPRSAAASRETTPSPRTAARWRSTSGSLPPSTLPQRGGCCRRR